MQRAATQPVRLHSGIGRHGRVQPVQRRGGRPGRRQVLRQQLEQPRRRRMEGDAGTSQLNPTGADGERRNRSRHPKQTQDVDSSRDSPTLMPRRRPSRLGRGWLVGICAVLVVLGAAAAAGGYLALRAHDAERGASRGPRRPRSQARQGVRGGHPGARHRRDDGQPVEDHRMRDRRFRRAGQAVQRGAGRRVPGGQVARCRCPICAPPSSGTTTTGRSTCWSPCGSRCPTPRPPTRSRDTGCGSTMAPTTGTYKIAKLDQVTS